MLKLWSLVTNTYRNNTKPTQLIPIHDDILLSYNSVHSEKVIANIHDSIHSEYQNHKKIVVVNCTNHPINDNCSYNHSNSINPTQMPVQVIDINVILNLDNSPVEQLSKLFQLCHVVYTQVNNCSELPLMLVFHCIGSHLSQTMLLLSCYLEYSNGHMTTAMDAYLNMVRSLPNFIKSSSVLGNMNGNGLNTVSNGTTSVGSKVLQFITDDTSSSSNYYNDVNSSPMSNNDTATTQCNEVIGSLLSNNQASIMRFTKFFNYLLELPMSDIFPLQLLSIRWFFDELNSNSTTTATMKNKNVSIGQFVYFILFNDKIYHIASGSINNTFIDLSNNECKIIGDFVLCCYWLVNDKFHKVFRFAYNTMFLNFVGTSSQLTLYRNQLDWISDNIKTQPNFLQQTKNLSIQLNFKKIESSKSPKESIEELDPKKYRELLEFHISQSPSYYINENAAKKFTLFNQNGISNNSNNSNNNNNGIAIVSTPNRNQMTGMNRVIYELENRIKSTLRRAQSKLGVIGGDFVSNYYNSPFQTQTPRQRQKSLDERILLDMSMDTNESDIAPTKLFALDENNSSSVHSPSLTHLRVRQLNGSTGTRRNSSGKKSCSTPSSDLNRKLNLGSATGSNSSNGSGSKKRKRQQNNMDTDSVRRLLQFSDNEEEDDIEEEKKEKRDLQSESRSSHEKVLLLDMSMDPIDTNCSEVTSATTLLQQMEESNDLLLPPPPPPLPQQMNSMNNGMYIGPPLPPPPPLSFNKKNSSKANAQTPLKKLHWTPLRLNQINQNRNSVWSNVVLKNCSSIKIPDMAQFEQLFARQASSSIASKSQNRHSISLLSPNKMIDNSLGAINNGNNVILVNDNNNIENSNNQNIDNSQIENMKSEPILSLQQSRNIEIVITSQFKPLIDLKATRIEERFSKLKIAIETLDTLKLDHSQLNNLYGFMTTVMTDDIREKLNAVSKHVQQLQNLTLPEQFLYVLNSIDRVSNYIQTMKYMHTWNTVYDTLLTKVSSKLDACELLARDSILLNQLVLPYVLVIGNMMNGTSGNTCGFNLDILPKLTDTKAHCHIGELQEQQKKKLEGTDETSSEQSDTITTTVDTNTNKSNHNFTLMHYLAYLLQEHEDVKYVSSAMENDNEQSLVLPSHFYKQFEKKIEQSMKITTNTLLILLSELGRHQQHFESELKYMELNNLHRSTSTLVAYNSLSSISYSATRQLASITELVERYKEVYNALLDYYQIKAHSTQNSSNTMVNYKETDDVHVDELFNTLHKFVVNYKMTLSENQEFKLEQRSKLLRTESMNRLKKKRRVE